MAAPPPTSSRLLQSMLQAAVQSVHWTYSLFWQLCPQQRILVWSDGYYNGAIKTRKTVQPTMEFTADEASLDRSKQLKELYESLLVGDTNGPHAAKRPCAALSPEDLTETEWFYLMCVSFTFPPGSGLPGKAYARRQHIWLNGANEVDCTKFSRAILAKSANIQTVVCIPLLDGVVELGTIEKVQEDLAFINHIKSFFTNPVQPPPPKPALSEHSTSNPAVSSNSQPPRLPLPPSVANRNQQEEEEGDDDNDNDDDDDVEADAVGIHGEAPGGAAELMQMEMSEDIRVGSPDDVSISLDDESGFHVLRTAGDGSAGGRKKSSRKWFGLVNQPSAPQPPSSSAKSEVSPEEDDIHYSETVSSILHSQSIRLNDTSSTLALNAGQSNHSAFDTWTNRPDSRVCLSDGDASQRLLKRILFTVPFLHEKPRDGDRPTTDTLASQDEVSVNHVMAERRRREKLNERFVILRSLVPFVTKMDKASILGDAIEYVKHLKERIQDLETRNNNNGNNAHPIEIEPRKNRTIQTAETAAKVDVSIIESDALLEMKCGYREGLLLDVLQKLRELRMETTAVQTAVNGGVFVAEIRAKVKESRNGKKPSITEVKRAIHQLIQI